MLDLVLVWQSVASGIVTGCVYALIALSLVIVYKSTDVINFAGGEVVMVGGYLGLFGLVFLDLPYALVFVLAAAVTFVLGALFDRIVLDKVLGRALPGQSILVAMVIATVGLSYALKGTVRLFPYAEQVRRLPPLFSGPPIFIGPVILQPQDLAIVAISVVLMLGLWLFFTF
ncbi:MAG: branched-chain amino acid ABC transporter permease, partial [Variovorax sp.]